MDSKLFAEKIADLIFNKKGYDVKILDLRHVATFSDFFVICSADSDTQVKAIADEVDKSLRDEGIKCWHKEGYTALTWILLDYVDVVVHVFKKDAREFYNIEKLWGDAPTVEVVDPALRKKTVKPKAKITAKSATKTPKKKTTK
ncbi:MAG: ribosome silencing factor [Ignavibacteriales bacterium]|nr:ribosome silencing factor [Ignavibacteriales bacterium]